MMTASKRILFAVCLAAVPLCGQSFPFQISSTQGNNTTNIANGGIVSLTAAGPGQTASVTFKLTYVGTRTVVITSAPQVFGSAAFAVVDTDAFPQTLMPGQALSFTVNYTMGSPVGTAAGSAQVSLPYAETGTQGATGTVSLNLSGTTPDLSVSYIFSSNGNVVPLASGGTISFPDTILNASTNVTVGIVNRGSGPGIVDAISTNGAFQLLGLPSLPQTVSPGSSSTFTIQFAPKQVGTSSGTLQMTLGGNSFSATLQGNGITSTFSYAVQQGGTFAAITPGQTITVPDTNVGSKNSVVVQVQNAGNVTASVNSITVTGTGFTITDSPSLPVVLGPNNSFTITVTLAPQQPGAVTGKLRVNNDTFNLSANALGAQFTYSYTANSATVTVVPGQQVIFSQPPVGQSSQVTFTVQNTGTAPGNIISIGTSRSSGSTSLPDVFSVANTPALPTSVAPGASLTFNVVFAPNNTGLATSNLLIDTAVFPLSGIGTAPVALPAYSFSGATGAQAPFQQPAVSLSLGSSYALPLTGVLVLTQDPGTLAPDPSVQFATSGRSVAFTIPANSTDAIFSNGTKQIRLQTGSVASTITLTPSFATQAGLDLTPASPRTLQLTVARTAPQLLTGSVVSKTATTFTLLLTGYTTSRSITGFQFQFTALPNVNLPLSKATLDASGASMLWFQNSTSQGFGGQFAVEIPFSIQVSSGTLASPVNDLQSVAVTATNDAGTSNSLSIPLQ